MYPTCSAPGPLRVDTGTRPVIGGGSSRLGAAGLQEHEPGRLPQQCRSERRACAGAHLTRRLGRHVDGKQAPTLNGTLRQDLRRRRLPVRASWRGLGQCSCQSRCPDSGLGVPGPLQLWPMAGWLRGLAESLLSERNTDKCRASIGQPRHCAPHGLRVALQHTRLPYSSLQEFRLVSRSTVR